MDIGKLAEQLKVDEGVVHEIYRCTEGYLTFGCGHKVIERDPEYGQPEGTPVSKERINEAFQKDLEDVAIDCKRLYSDFGKLPPVVQEIIGNMLFNLGLKRLAGFKNMQKAVEAGDWKLASEEMKDSKWYRQVKTRAVRLCNRMANVRS